MLRRYVLLMPVVLAFLTVTGCGSDEASREPKQELTEKEQEQVKELYKQRQDEWSSTNTKKK